MGMNYYLEDKKCCECGRSEKYHIGKRSYGWEFSFQAWSACEFYEIRSWDTWKKVIMKFGGVVNEDGKIIPAGQFIELVEDTRELLLNADGSARRPLNHYDYCKENHPNTLHNQWKDEDGWSFTHGDFS